MPVKTHIYSYTKWQTNAKLQNLGPISAKLFKGGMPSALLMRSPL